VNFIARKKSKLKVFPYKIRIEIGVEGWGSGVQGWGGGVQGSGVGSEGPAAPAKAHCSWFRGGLAGSGMRVQGFECGVGTDEARFRGPRF
jgi:hypothetical protein